MLSGKRWKVAASRLLVAVLAVTMVFTMMPAAGGYYAYAETGSLETMTPEVVVSGTAVIGGSAYTADNVSLERSYTRDELKELPGGVNVQYSSKKTQEPYTKLLYRASGVYLTSLLDGTAFDPENDVLTLSSNEPTPYVVTFDPAVTEPGRLNLTGLGVQRYFFPGVLVEDPADPEEVQPMLSWANANSSSADPESAGSDKKYLTLVVGQLSVDDQNNAAYGKYMTYVTGGDPLTEVVLTVGSKEYTRADILMMEFAEASYSYSTSGGDKTDSVRGVPMSVLLKGEEPDSIVSFEAADGYDMSSASKTVQELIDGNYMLAYEANGKGIYKTAKNDPSKYGFLTLYGDGAKPASMVNKISVTTPSGIDYSTSPYKHITNGGQEGSSPYNIDSITGATLTVEGPGVKTSVPVSVRDLEGRDAGAARADYTDLREGSNVTRTYEGIDLYYILHNMSSGDNGIILTDLAKKVLIKNRNRNTIAEFTTDQVEEAHNNGKPILVAYGTSLTNGENVRPFVFNNAAGADPDLGNEDGCLKLVYDKSSITGDGNEKYKKFGNMAYIYVADADTPGYKHDKDPYQSPDISNYIVTVTGDKIGMEVNYTVDQIEGMVGYDSEGKPDNSGMGYRDEYSLANSTYWYVNEYEGVQLWKLLLKSGLDPALADDDETLVSSTATDGYAATDKFTVKQVADPDSFGFYEKNPEDPNTAGWSHENNEVMRDDDHPNGDLIAKGYPVLVAYGVNGYPYVEKASQAGYISGLQNDGGPLRIISGKKQYNHANGSNQAKYLDKIIVGDNTNHYSTHKYNPKNEYTELAENSTLEVKILNGADEDAPVLKEKTFKLGDIEELIYGGSLTTNKLKEAKVKTFYQLAKGSSSYSDLYEGVNLNFFLEEVVELPGHKGTITFSNGTNELTLSLEDVLAVDNGSNTETGMSGLVPLLAYGKNGSPMVLDKNAQGYEKEVTLAAGTEYENKITIKNDGGPLAVLFPHTDSSVSDQSLTNVTSITINLSADQYAHTKDPYNSYADYEVTISGEGTRLGTEGKAFKLSELEGKQTLAFTGDYSILKSGDGQTASQTRYRGIKLYSLLTSSSVGLKSNADKVIVTTSDGESKEFTLSQIRKSDYINSVTGDANLPVILAYGVGKAGDEDKEDGLPLVAEKTSEGYDSSYGNNGGPVRLAVGQADAEDVNSGSNLKYVKSIEVTASEMSSWNHNSAEVYKQYRKEPVQLVVNDKDGKELYNKTFTVGEIEDNSSLAERIVATVVQEFTWEGINFWKWVKQEVGNNADLSDPISVTVTAEDGYSQEIRAKFGIDGLENGIKDGENRVPIILAYGVGGYPLVIGDKNHKPDGEGYDATAGNNGGPLRLITHNSQGTSLTYVTKITIVASEGGSQPEVPADFTIRGLKSGDVEMTVEDIKNLKNSSGDSVGQAEGEYVRKGVTKKVKGALLKNILAANSIDNENTVITLNTPDSFETTEKGASYNNITLKQAVDQKYFLAYQEFVDGEWKDIDDTVKGTEIHTNLRMYRNYCEANGLSNQDEWYDECTNITAITLEVPEVTAFKEYPTTGGIRSTWMDNANTIWVGTYGGGLYYKKAGDSEFSRYNTSSTPALKTDFTSAVAADAEGGIWVSQNASYTNPGNNQGVLYIKDGEITQYTVENNPGTIPNNYVQAIKVDTDGKVWFGSFGGLTIYDPASGTWTTYGKGDKDFPATSINTIVLDGQGGAWLGFYPDGSGTEEDPYAGGFCHIDKNGTVSEKNSIGGVGDPMFAQSWIRSIAIDNKGTVWAVAAGTNIEDNVGGRIFKLKNGSGEPTVYTGKEVLGDYLDGSSTTEVRVVAVDKDGNLWFGTSADGVLKVENPKLNAEGKMDVTAQYAKETGSWSAANMNNVYSIDFWNDGTAYVGTSGGLLVLGDEPQGDGGDEPVEPAGDATPEDAALTVTGTALVRDGYFSIKGIKNAEGIEKKDATFNWQNSSGTTGTASVQGATLENIFNDVIGMKGGAEIESVELISSDGRKTAYTAEQALGTSLDGNKAMFIWTEDGEKVQKVIVGQFAEGENNRSKWAKDVEKIIVNKVITNDDYEEEAKAAAEEAMNALDPESTDPTVDADEIINAADSVTTAVDAVADQAVEAAQKAVEAAQDGTPEEQAAAQEMLKEAEKFKAATSSYVAATKNAAAKSASQKAATAKAKADAAAATPGQAAVDAAKAAKAAADEAVTKAQVAKDATDAALAAAEAVLANATTDEEQAAAAEAVRMAREAAEQAQTNLSSAKQAAAAAENAVIAAEAAKANAEAAAAAAANAEIVDLPAVKISKASPAKKAATVRWKKVSKKNKQKIAKIQVQYSTDKTFTSADTKTKFASKSKTSLKIKKLKSKKTYYFRVRAYKVIDGKVHVSKWSKTKKAKVK